MTKEKKTSAEISSSLLSQQLQKRKLSKSLNESLASLEEALFEAEKNSNKRKQDAIKAMIRCLKKKKTLKS